MRFVVLIATLVVSFPALFAAPVHARRNCETVRQLALQRDADAESSSSRLTGAERGRAPGAAIRMQTRPDVVGALDSDTLPVRVHWQVEAFAERAPELLALIEDAWDRQVTI